MPPGARRWLWTLAATDMTHTLHAYYLDEPLSVSELDFADESFIGDHARFRTDADRIEQRRVPAVLPVVDARTLSTTEFKSHMTLVRGNLRNAGIRADVGRQVLWVVPKDLRWGVLLQNAIYEETGYMPFMFKRWRYTEVGPEATEPSILDAHGLAFGGS